MKLRAWLQLFRAPNLFTVPGDPLAGFLIATGGILDARVVPAIIASLCIYAAGLAMNDVIDTKEDLADRPNRPLPSGAISRSAAITAILALCAIGIGTLHAGLGPRSAVMGVALLTTVWLYNATTKRIPIIGAINMGLCRGLSLILGAIAGAGLDSTTIAWADALPFSFGMLMPYFVREAEQTNKGLVCATVAAICITFYIAAVTNLARHETKPIVPKLAKMLPLAAIFVGFTIIKLFTNAVFWDSSPALWLVAVMLCVMQTGDLLKTPPRPIPPAIGGYIRLLLVMQAALCVMPGNAYSGLKTLPSLLSAFALLSLVPLSAWAGKKFYAS